MTDCMAVTTSDGHVVYITSDMTDEQVQAVLGQEEEPGAA